MPDIICPNCDEPWDSYHMRHDAAHEWNLSPIELDEFLKTGRFSGPQDRILEAAEAEGWKFSTLSVLSFYKCPCCPRDGESRTPLRDKIAQQRIQDTITVSQLMDDDEDALVSMRGLIT